MAVRADVCDLDLRGVADAIAHGKISALEATEAYLARIERDDPVLRAYITVLAEPARARARELDAEQARGRRRGPLHGVPVALKDLIDVAGARTTAGSRRLADNVASTDAPTTERLREAGAVILGKTSLHEFAFGRPVLEGPLATGHNPWDLRRAPAGSSSGSAVAVAAGLCAGAVGSDTGGSIRGPASMCGIVGHKPTYDLVSRRGVVPMDWSLDHVGPMTRDVWGSAAMLQVLAGPAADADYLGDLDRGVRGLRLGVLRRFYVEWPGLDDEVRDAALAAFEVLRADGAVLVDVDAPALDLALPAWVAFLAEMYDYHAADLARCPERYSDRLRPRILMGALVTGSDYVRAQRLRGRLRREVHDVLHRDADVLIFPGQAAPAATFEDVPMTGVMPTSGRYTVPWNLLGLPAVAVPSGFSRGGLPVAIQIAGRAHDDAGVLRVARAYERATSWHTRRPPRPYLL